MTHVGIQVTEFDDCESLKRNQLFIKITKLTATL